MITPGTVAARPALYAPVGAWAGQVKGWWWGQHSLKLHGRKADDIAARAKIDFVLSVQLDVGIGNQGRVQGQGKSRKALHATVRAAWCKILCKRNSTKSRRDAMENA